MPRAVDIYGGKSPVEVPTYSLPEVAHILHLPRTTVASWVLGRPYRTEAGPRHFTPVIQIADPKTPLLSFLDLVELHVLSAIRRDHRVKLKAVRRAIVYLRQTFDSEHPLLAQKMVTDGTDLFIERYGEYVSISQDGKMAMKQVMGVYLRRIERDPAGLPIRLYPFTSSRISDSPKAVAIDPRIQFGRPCLAGTGIRTAVIIERYKAGDSIESLAEDYEITPSDIEEALRYEIPTAA